MPLIVGGSAGPLSAQVAARAADEYNTIFVTPDEAGRRRAAVADAWEDAGRDRASRRFSLLTGCLVAGDEDMLVARAGRLAERRATGRTPDAELAEAQAGPWIAGTPDRAVTRLRALAEAGVDRVMLQLHLHDELDQIELIGRTLAPELR
jgi:alkanesulfonate monooxygenase SsuD/methylene tetrahydromethanopterin reductase-like flavin-dependent oxidoreductase (luciferase family)